MASAEQSCWFSEHVQPHEPALRAFLANRFPTLPDHDDLVQEIYIRILRIENPFPSDQALPHNPVSYQFFV